MQLVVDGREVEPPRDDQLQGHDAAATSRTWRSPLGYTNASWTLKCDLTCEYVCRLLAHMDAHGYSRCTPRNSDPSLGTEPFIDFSSGYIRRSIDRFPRQGSRRPWRLHQNYALDIVALRMATLEDGTLEFAGRSGG